MKKRHFSKIAALVSLVLTSMVTLTVAMTAAAFLMFEKHQQTIVINADYSSYFGSKDPNVKADGTVNNPFIISTPEHLRNLSYLVNMGVFNETHNFELKTFTYDTKALTPIGTEQFPFKSHFYGAVSQSNNATVPSIKNLVVEGNNLSDVGLFGVVGASARIHDFILDSPTINVSGTAPYNADKIDQNPLRDITATYQGSDYIFSKANISSQITLENTTPIKDGQNVVGTAKLTLKKGTLPNEYAFDAKSKVPLTYYCSSSNTNLVTMSGDINTGTAVFTVNQKATNPDTSANKRVGDYVVIEIGVRGIVSTPNGNRYAQMTLERFKLYYDYNKQYVIADPQDARMFKKIINPAIIKIKENDTQMHLDDDSKGIFVGAVIGMLYGDARRIGVYNAILNIKRPFISNSILVGRTLDDDENKNMTKEEFSVPKIITDTDTKLTYSYTPKKLINYGNISNTDLSMGNRIVTNIYGRQAISQQSQNTIRIYGTRRPKNDQASENPSPVPNDEGVVLTTNNVYTGKKDDGSSDGQYLVDPTTIASDQPYQKLPAISFRKTMQEGLHAYQGPTFGTGDVYYGRGYKDMEISNSIMLWISGADGKSGLDRWLANGIDFYLDVELDYAFYVEDADTLPNYNSSSVEIGIEGTRKFIEPYQTGEFWNPYSFSYDFPNNGVKRGDDSRGKINHMDLVYAHEIVEREEANNIKNSYYYPFGAYQYAENDKKDARDLTRFKSNEINGKPSLLTDSNHIGVVHKKHIKIKSRTAKLNVGHNKGKKNLYPLFFIGLKHTGELLDILDQRIHQNPMPPAPPIPNFRFDIYGMKITLSDLKGNINSTIGQIDFVDNATTLPISSNGWNGSNIKVGAKTIENSKVVPNSSADTTKLMNVHSEASGITNYKITTSKSGNTVTISWSPIGSTATQFAYIQPRSNIKYNNLVVNKV